MAIRPEQAGGEAELRWDESMLRALLEANLDAVVIVDPEGTILLLNRATEKMFRWDRERLIGLPVETLIPGRFHQSHLDARAEYSSHPHTRPMSTALDLWGRRSDGTEFPVDIGLSPAHADGRFVVIAVVRDMTDVRRVQHVSAELAAIVESSADAIVAASRAGIITSWNPAAERLYGYPTDDVIGHHYSLLVPEDQMADSEDTIRRLLEGHKVEGWETRQLRKDGTPFDVEVTASPLIDATGRIVGMSAIVRDITERKQLDSERAQFIANAAHELRTPLTALSGLAELLSAQSLRMSDEQRTEALEALGRQGKRARELVEHLLDLSRIDAGRAPAPLQPVDLSRAVETAAAEVVPNSGTEIHISAPPGVNVLADPVRLDQILVNLLANAMRYGGPHVTVDVTTSDHSAEVTITDDGAGVPDELVPRLFTPFARGANAAGRPGSGLGLAIVRRLAEALGGSIRYERAEPHGARFCVVLRRAT